MNAKDVTSKRKRILYVDRGPLPLTKPLGKKYDVDPYKNLDYGVVDLIRQLNRRFDAMITHIPHKSIGRVSFISLESIFLAQAYGESLQILRQIKMIVDIPIIAYTGAGDSPAIYSVFMEDGGIDHILHKSRNLSQDVQEIHTALRELFLKYEQILQLPSPPSLRTDNGYITVDVRININGGAGLSSAAKISQECQRYLKEVWFKKSGSEDSTSCNAKNVLDFLAMPPEEGEIITILVKGEDEEAKRLARRLYSAFSCRYSFTIDFDRFERHREKD